MRLPVTSPFLLALAACATEAVGPVNSDFFLPAAAEISKSFELRDRYNLPKPTGGTAIYVHSVAVHHVYSDQSTIVWKDQAGKWQRSQAVQVGPSGLLRIERKLESHEITALTDAEARSLERVITDPKLYSGKVRRTGSVGISAAYHVMAIVTPFGRTTIKWDGRLRGTSGAVADLVLGHE